MDLDVFLTRGAFAPPYHVITPANRAPSTLPELSATTVHKLVTPRRAPARFAQYLLRVEPGGGTRPERPPAGRPGFEHFLYGLSGASATTVTGAPHDLAPGRFAYLAPGHGLALANPGLNVAEVLWVTREYEPAPGFGAPQSVAGNRDALGEVEFSPGLWRTELFASGDPRYDFSMIRMRFSPGVDLAMVELHDEEHGLFMTAGSGLYLLGSDRHRVESGDFIYMAPYCPQSFVADPVEGAEYLLYKDFHRDGF